MNNKDLRKTLITETINHLQDNRKPIMNLTPSYFKKRKNPKIKKKLEKIMKSFDEELIRDITVFKY